MRLISQTQGLFRKFLFFQHQLKELKSLKDCHIYVTTLWENNEYLRLLGMKNNGEGWKERGILNKSRNGTKVEIFQANEMAQ